MAVQAKQGRAVFGVDMKIVGDDGQELPHDGKASGELLVRGPWIIANYFKGEGGDPLVDGWFPTGDVSTIDADGFMQITDRSKDVIKSGGEWIGSIDLENIAMAHPAVAMAACIGARHPKWDERPLLVVVKKPGAEVTRDELLALLRGQDRQVVDARRRRLRRRDPARRHRQDAEEQAARAVRRTTSCPRPERLRRMTTLSAAVGPARPRELCSPGVLACVRRRRGGDLPVRALRRAGDAVRAAARHGDELPVGDGPCAAGIEFTARQVLRFGVALLGLRITIGQIAELGWQPVAIVVVSVVLTIGVSMLVGPADGLPDAVRPAQRRRHRDLRRLRGARAWRRRCRRIR